MFLMRIDYVIGMCEIDGYEKLRWEPGGWFPINDFSFSVKKPTKPKGNSSTGGTGGTAGTDPNKKPKPTITVSKPVDSGTCNLMFLAMVHKAGAKGLPSLSQAEKKKLTNLMVDIHHVGSVWTKEGMCIVSHFLVHLENVEIKTWSIQASGDDRPEESLELVYEKAATCYRGLGKTGDIPAADIAGWNQVTDQKWPLTDMKQDYFPNFPKKT